MELRVYVHDELEVVVHDTSSELDVDRAIRAALTALQTAQPMRIEVVWQAGWYQGKFRHERRVVLHGDRFIAR
jgi:hypothetical protein